MSREKFYEWVKKWNIGPGMNDAHYAKRHNKPTPENYSGIDGDVGNGWIPIIDRLTDDLIKLGWDRDLHQIKEKFGTLRFYIGKGSPEIHERISQAELESGKTCEWCGAPAVTRGPGWYRTLCDPCDKRYVAGERDWE